MDNFDDETIQSSNNENISSSNSAHKIPNTVKLEKILTPRLLDCLDKMQITDRNAMHLITAVADALGHKIENIVLSRGTIQRSRKRHRESASTSIRDNFEVKK